MKLEGRTILITGGTSGIGFEMARQLLARRNTVIITGRDLQKLREAESALPGVHTVQSDASEPGDIQALQQRIVKEFQSCDTLPKNGLHGAPRRAQVDGAACSVSACDSAPLSLNSSI